jgi:protein-S-isoprenylcysteine O-methyltransferase Ste14
MSANYSGTKKSLKSKTGTVSRRATGYLQSLPPNLLAASSILQFISCFPLIELGFFNLEINSASRLVFFLLFIIFSVIQILSFKSLGNYYSTDIMLYKNHKLIKTGIYKFIRHPQYFSQILADMFVGIALLSMPVVLLTLLCTLPLLILRAKKEEEMLSAHFTSEFNDYKKKSGFFIPFL